MALAPPWLLMTLGRSHAAPAGAANRVIPDVKDLIAFGEPGSLNSYDRAAKSAVWERQPFAALGAKIFHLDFRISFA